jgi:uncharacterized protein (DUF58 family)
MADRGTAISQRVLQLAERWLPALTRLRKAEALPIAITRRRIYILPTPFGLAFAAMLAVMLMGALNFNNNPALLLTCLLGSAAFLSMYQAFRNLDGIALISIHAEPGHAGDSLPMRLRLDDGGRRRRALRLDSMASQCVFDLAPADDNSTQLQWPATHRGMISCGRQRLWTDFPYGLFRAWSYLNADVQLLVYPQLDSASSPLPADAGASEDRSSQQSGDEIGSLRDYRNDDPRRLIAWKASARHGTLLVKEFEQRQGNNVVLDWNRLSHLGGEARISRLARWVVDAEVAHLRYELRLPAERLGPDNGPQHRHACLRALALLPRAPT